MDDKLEKMKTKIKNIIIGLFPFILLVIMVVVVGFDLLTVATVLCNRRWDLSHRYILGGGCQVEVAIRKTTTFVPEKNIMINYQVNGN